jgi:ABC-type Fe3+/spermidine/putrescine transport system ATPase subunit
MPEVRIASVSKSYGSITALRDVSLDVHDGEYLSIVGPSGCGKTSLIKSIAGIVQPDSGQINIGERPVTTLPVEDREVGYVFQEIALFPHMTIRENVSYGLMVKGVPLDERRRQVSGMLDLMALSDRASSYPSELSGGAMQKTAVARALVSGSSLLLLDEPLGALDLKVRTVLRYELRGLVKDLGLTAIHVTHDQEEALSISDRVAVMKAGRVLEVGEPLDLYMRPGRLFTAKFLGEANFMEGKVVEASGGECLVDAGGLNLRAKTEAELGLRKGDPVVLAIRPEFIGLGKKEKRSRRNRVRGIVKGIVFAGDVVRYEIEAENGCTLSVKYFLSLGETGIKSGDEVVLDVPRDRLLAYRYPEEGLEKELSLE